MDTEVLEIKLYLTKAQIRYLKNRLHKWAREKFKFAKDPRRMDQDHQFEEAVMLDAISNDLKELLND